MTDVRLSTVGPSSLNQASEVQASSGHVQIDPGSGAHGLSQISGKITSPPEKDLSKFTTWGSGFSLGRLVGSAIRLPGRLLVKAGEALENSKGIRNQVVGTGIKTLGNVIGAAGGVVGHGVSLAERAVINTLKGLGGLLLSGVGLLARLGGNKSILNAGVSLMKDAWMTRGETQKPLTTEKAKQVQPLANLMQVTGSSSTTELPDGFTAMKTGEVPKKWQKYYSQPDNLHNKGLLRTGPMSALQVSLSHGPDGKIFVAFKGTEVSLSRGVGTLTSDALGAFGVADSAFRMARDLVKDLEKQYPGKVHVVGHSLGGALAQFAGIKAGVPVTCFNSMGLPAHLCDKLVDLSELGKGKLQHARVEHFNSSSDPLSEKFQTRYLPLGLSQLGDRYKVEDGRGHRMGGLNDAINQMAR